MRNLLIFTMVLLFPMLGNAQNVFGTTKGVIYIKGIWNDTLITAGSNEVTIFLDQDVTNFSLVFEKSSLKTGIDTLDNLLSEMEDDFIQFEGEFDLKKVMTVENVNANFKVQGHLTCDPVYAITCSSENKQIVGVGELVHLENTYTYNLDMNFHINLKEINYDIGLQGLFEEIDVEVFETILSKDF